MTTDYVSTLDPAEPDPMARVRLKTVFALFLVSAPALASAQAGNGGVSLAGIGHDTGSTRAKVFVVEFADFGCGYCARWNVETYPKVDSAHVRSGVIRFKMVPFVTGMFRNSRDVAEAAECAAEQGGFWKMHDLLYAKRKEWMASNDIRSLINTYVTQLKLQPVPFSRCLMNPEIRRRIQRHDAIASQLAIRGTPTFFVNGRIVPGAVPFDLFSQVITAAAK
jgi:protein-disulfide isomerase